MSVGLPNERARQPLVGTEHRHLIASIDRDEASMLVEGDVPYE